MILLMSTDTPSNVNKFKKFSDCEHKARRKYAQADLAKRSDLTLNREDFNKVKEIHRNWYFFAIKALLGQLAKELLRSSDSASHEKLKLCLKRIAYTKDLRKTATCISKAREHWKRHLKFNRPRKKIGRHRLQLNNKRRSFARYRNLRLWVQGKNRIVPGKNPVHMPAKKEEDEKRASSLSTRIFPLQSVKSRPERLILPNGLKDNRDYFEVKRAGYLPPLRSRTSKSPIHRVSDLFVSLFGKAAVDELPDKWSSTYKSIEKLSKIMDRSEQLPGARVYNTRIFDIVVDNKYKKSNEKVYVPPFLKNAFDIVNSFNDAENVRILSPRIVPILPDKASRGILSPSLFPFYKDDTDQSILSIPRISQMLKTAGLNEKDRERVLEMIMEVSGARETVDKAMKVLQHLNSIGMDEKLFSINEKIGKVFEQLRSSFTPYQSKELDRKGFTLMSSDQMERLHQGQDLHEPAIRAQLDKYKSVPSKEREQLLWESVAELAGLNKRRRKRQIQPLVVLKPTVLSPYQFAPVYGFSVLGPVFEI
ncbi:hypothetical protein ANCDUO_14177 [Ancylostoma duodenale]|uniref:Uncharacterized protein n=1 Tax=Ancylostoma duodenale TaxID=51022 RepID=A0A0C2G3Y2_9BILA|nr:hypothetical protein ANCDUO_14177 [Ancylostoma duodenale]